MAVSFDGWFWFSPGLCGRKLFEQYDKTEIAGPDSAYHFLETSKLIFHLNSILCLSILSRKL
jgi:hypothetical protein